MITIFINERPIYLTDSQDYKASTNFFEYKEMDIKQLVQEVELGKREFVYIYDKNVDRLLINFRSCFTYIEAAGGVVKNSRGDILFIYRNDVWDLPKGKLENKEKIEDAAIREVEEETGVSNLKIIRSLDNTYHIYTFQGEKVFKITYWFEMNTVYDKELYPQLEEGITKVAWLNKSKIIIAMKNTYANIQFLVKSLE